MTPAVASLAALLIAIVASMTTRINVGLLAIVLAWVVGAGVAELAPQKIAAGFPGELFVTLMGVTLLFAIAEQNGTLARYTGLVLRSARGDARVLPVLFFVLAAVVSTVGPGAIASVALLAPVAMPVAVRAGVSPLLMALMVGNGANAGNLSPVSTVGLIANSRMAEAGLIGHEWRVWAANGVVHIVVAVAAYLLFGGWRASRGNTVHLQATPGDVDASDHRRRDQRITLMAIAAWVLSVIVFRWPPGLSAVAVAALLLILRTEDERVALRAVPWGVPPAPAA
jgi:Na+/H+ antiporter NhaD/arsenite permease-like protein